MPWLLKLNGDIVHPESLTLTSGEFEEHKVESEALAGVVQSLMLTSHLRFVGFSFRNKSFLELAAGCESSAGSGFKWRSVVDRDRTGVDRRGGKFHPRTGYGVAANV